MVSFRCASLILALGLSLRMALAAASGGFRQEHRRTVDGRLCAAAFVQDRQTYTGCTGRKSVAFDSGAFIDVRACVRVLFLGLIARSNEPSWRVWTRVVLRGEPSGRERAVVFLRSVLVCCCCLVLGSLCVPPQFIVRAFAGLWQHTTNGSCAAKNRRNSRHSAQDAEGNLASLSLWGRMNLCGH